ncbi:MAG: orotate phosphoribosyltransferase [Gemmatimonadota bacterium]|nr:orotate phosphoribosyltransferase [Gemmatimonadota bacterium]
MPVAPNARATADGLTAPRIFIAPHQAGVALTEKVAPRNVRSVSDQTRRLVDLLRRHSVQRGSFTLASGRTSSLYVDARLTTMHPEGLAIIGPLALSRLLAAQLYPDSVGGLTLGADPVSYAIAYASASSGRPVRAFTVRKEPKAHGTGRLIEGPFRSTDRVVVVEDVITTGGSALRAITTVRAAGATVIAVLAVVDREEGGRDAIAAAGVPVLSLATASDLTEPL